MISRAKQIGAFSAVVALAALTGVAIWLTSGPWVASKRLDRVMGTEARLVAVVGPGEEAVAERAFADAEKALRSVEARMSRRIEASEVGRFNAAPAGERVELSSDTLAVLAASRELHEATGGAFDATCLPILRAWAEAGGAGRLPEPAALAQARAASNWAYIDFDEAGAVKHCGSAGVDLGGIAKGCGIDRAVAAMQDAGIRGGLVDVGGDVRCFGRPVEGDRWPVAVLSPFDDGPLAHLALRGGAVCTSAHYARFTEIDGVRYSHIVDPRPGPEAGMALRADIAPASVTVHAPTAMTADGWATALSVLGKAGLARLPAGVEAMVVTGGAGDYKVHMTAGFEALLDGPVRRPGE